MTTITIRISYKKVDGTEDVLNVAITNNRWDWTTEEFVETMVRPAVAAIGLPYSDCIVLGEEQNAR